MLHFAIGTSRDVPHAARLYGAACDAGHAAACTRIGNLYGKGLGVRKDNTTAYSFFMRACELGGLSGCSGVANAKVDGWGTPVDLPGALRIASEVCAKDGAHGCATLGRMYETGAGVEKDVRREAECSKPGNRGLRTLRAPAGSTPKHAKRTWLRPARGWLLCMSAASAVAQTGRWPLRSIGRLAARRTRQRATPCGGWVLIRDRCATSIEAFAWSRCGGPCQVSASRL
jgi:hypothetical protein